MIYNQPTEDPTLAPPRASEGEQCVSMVIVVGSFGRPDKVIPEVRAAVTRRLWLEFGPAAFVTMDGVRYRYHPQKGVMTYDPDTREWSED